MTYDVFLLVAILLMAGAVILLNPVPQRGALAFYLAAPSRRGVGRGRP